MIETILEPRLIESKLEQQHYSFSHFAIIAMAKSVLKIDLVILRTLFILTNTLKFIKTVQNINSPFTIFIYCSNIIIDLFIQVTVWSILESVPRQTGCFTY
jgi:hypothetical protein